MATSHDIANDCISAIMAAAEKGRGKVTLPAARAVLDNWSSLYDWPQSYKARLTDYQLRKHFKILVSIGVLKHNHNSYLYNPDNPLYGYMRDIASTMSGYQDQHTVWINYND